MTDDEAARAKQLAEDGHLDEAIRIYEAALAADPRDVPAAYGLGILRFTQGALEGAIAAFTTVIDLEPGDASAWFNRGVCYKRQADAAGRVSAESDGLVLIGGPAVPLLEQAVADYTKAIELRLRPEDLVNRATALHALGRREASIADARRASTLGDPKAKRFLREVLGADEA